MIRARNCKTVSKFVKVMPRILWPLFSRTRCICSLYSRINDFLDRNDDQTGLSLLFFTDSF